MNNNDYVFIVSDKQARELFIELKDKLKWFQENGGYDYIEYTEDRLNEYQKILKRKKLAETDWFITFIQLAQIYNEVIKLHFKGALTLDFVLLCCSNHQIILQFIKYMDRMSDDEYWKYLRLLYIKQEYKVEYELLKGLFLNKRANRHKLMSDEDLVFFNSLPEKITIYRAMTKSEAKSDKFRLSWTLDRKIADFFFERFGRPEDMVIKKLEVPKSECIAYFSDLNEAEIIYIHQ